MGQRTCEGYDCHNSPDSQFQNLSFIGIANSGLQIKPNFRLGLFYALSDCWCTEVQKINGPSFWWWLDCVLLGGLEGWCSEVVSKALWSVRIQGHRLDLYDCTVCKYIHILPISESAYHNWCFLSMLILSDGPKTSWSSEEPREFTICSMLVSLLLCPQRWKKEAKIPLHGW